MGESVGDDPMGVTPAEPSRPGSKWAGSRSWVEEPFWSGVTIFLFLAGLVMLAEGAVMIADFVGSGGAHKATDAVLPLAVSVVGILIVVGLLRALSKNPRTRSSSATTSFTIMKALMFISGIILFFSGVTQIVGRGNFEEQTALALVSLFYVVTPLSLHLMRK